MTVYASLIGLLAVLLLPEGWERRVDPASESEFRAEAEADNFASAQAKPKSARIRSRRTDLDRDDGVIMFEGDVFVEYADDYTMNADRLFAFFAGTNSLSRIVASGGVSITNAMRTGDCQMAVFRNRERRIEMYGDERRPARLTDCSDGRNAVVGSKITFWIDTEQVEVIAPVISLEEKNVR